jgi:predicted  nucleic acid-binding Zn-ribbon protein
MDQPGTNHYAVQISQQAVNGRNGYYGQAGYDSNGYAANGHGAGGYGRNGYTGSGGQPAVAYQAGVAAGAARTAPDAAATAAEAPMDATVAQDAATREHEGNAVEDAGRPDGQGTEDAAASTAAAAGNSPAERMRELLARSTADHAAIERATATSLEEIRQRLAGLERAVAEVRERAGTEQDSASRTAEEMSTQAQRLAGMSATLDGLTAGLSTFSAQLSTIDGRMANADSRLAGADVKLASTESRVSALDTRFERLDERLDDQYDRVTSIDNRLAATDGRLTLLGSQFTEALKPVAEELRARPVRSEIEAVVTKIVEAVHADISTRLTSLEDTVLTLAEALLRPAAGHTPPSQLRQRTRPLTLTKPATPPKLLARAQPPAPGRLRLPRGRASGRARARAYSHSIVPGGLLVTSRTTRFTSGTSLVIRVEIRASTSCGSRAQSAVIASSLVTGRSTTGCP